MFVSDFTPATDGERIARAMELAYVADSIVSMEVDPARLPYDVFREYYWKVIGNLRSCPWTKVSNASQDFGGPNGPVAAYNRARSLTSEAFSDMDAFIQLCGATANINPTRRSNRFERLLQNSSKTIIKLAALPEDEKLELVENLENIWSLRAMVGDNGVSSQLVHATSETEQAYLDWHPAVTDWIQSRYVQGRGCPALRIAVEDEDHTASLVASSWHRLTRLMYREGSDRRPDSLLLDTQKASR